LTTSHLTQNLFLCVAVLPTLIYPMWLSFSRFKLLGASDLNIYCTFSCSWLYRPSVQK